MYCAPSHSSNAEKQYAGQEFVVADGLREPSLQKRRKSGRFGKRPSYWKAQAEACVTKPQDRRTREPT